MFGGLLGGYVDVSEGTHTNTHIHSHTWADTPERCVLIIWDATEKAPMPNAEIFIVACVAFIVFLGKNQSMNWTRCSQCGFSVKGGLGD